MKPLWLAAVLLSGWMDVAVAADIGNGISAGRARSLYVLHCAGCHQLDGSGTPSHGVPGMRNTLGYFLRSPAGRALLVQVPGARNAGVSDAELAALTNWQLRTFAQESLPIDFIPYQTEEVSRWRANPPLDVSAARAAVLRDLQERGELSPTAAAQLMPNAK